MENVPAGDYRVRIRAPGFRADAQTGVKIAAGQDRSLDFALQERVVRWNDISIYQASKLWPAAPAIDKIFAKFFLDADGRLWYGTPSNNKVGYFYLKGGSARNPRAGIW